jgi:hypothetical protein
VAQHGFWLVFRSAGFCICSADLYCSHSGDVLYKSLLASRKAGQPSLYAKPLLWGKMLKAGSIGPYCDVGHACITFPRPAFLGGPTGTASPAVLSSDSNLGFSPATVHLCRMLESYLARPVLSWLYDYGSCHESPSLSYVTLALLQSCAKISMWYSECSWFPRHLCARHVKESYTADIARCAVIKATWTIEQMSTSLRGLCRGEGSVVQQYRVKCSYEP